MLEVHGVKICKHLEAMQLLGNVGSVFFLFFFFLVLGKHNRIGVGL